MNLIGRIGTRIAAGIASALVAKVAFEICYRQDFYPEEWLADLTLGLLTHRVALWLLAGLLALAIWLVLEFVVAQFLRSRIGRLKMTSDRDRPPPKHISEFKNAEEMANYMGDIISPNFPLPLRSPARVAADAQRMGNPAVQIFDSLDGTIDGVSVPAGTSAVGVDRSARVAIKNIEVRDKNGPKKG